MPSFMSSNKIVRGFPRTTTLTVGGVTGDFVKLIDAEQCLMFIVVEDLTDVLSYIPTTITVIQSSTVSGGGGMPLKIVPFTKYYSMLPGTGNDTWTESTADSYISTEESATPMWYAIPIDVGMLDKTNGYDWIRLSVAEIQEVSLDYYVSCYYFMNDFRYTPPGTQIA